MTGHTEAVSSAREHRQLARVIPATEIHTLLQARCISKFAEVKRIPVCGRLLFRAGLRFRLGAP